jgi:PEP-CTERM motif
MGVFLASGNRWPDRQRISAQRFSSESRAGRHRDGATRLRSGFRERVTEGAGLRSLARALRRARQTGPSVDVSYSHAIERQTTGGREFPLKRLRFYLQKLKLSSTAAYFFDPSSAVLPAFTEAVDASLIFEMNLSWATDSTDYRIASSIGLSDPLPEVPLRLTYTYADPIQAPEPGVGAIFGLGAAGLALTRRRRRARPRSSTSPSAIRTGNDRSIDEPQTRLIDQVM